MHLVILFNHYEPNKQIHENWLSIEILIMQSYNNIVQQTVVDFLNKVHKKNYNTILYRIV